MPTLLDKVHLEKSSNDGVAYQQQRPAEKVQFGLTKSYSIYLCMFDHSDMRKGFLWWLGEGEMKHSLEYSLLFVSSPLNVQIQKRNIKIIYPLTNKINIKILSFIGCSSTTSQYYLIQPKRTYTYGLCPCLVSYLFSMVINIGILRMMVGRFWLRHLDSAIWVYKFSTNNTEKIK